MTEYYSCRLCTLEVDNDDKSAQCNLFDRWIHINYAEINNKRNDKHFKNHSYSLFLLMDIFLKHLWLIPNILK